MTNVRCVDNKNAYFKLSVTDGVIQNPEAGFGQDVAVLSIDWSKVKNVLASVPKEQILGDGEQEYLNTLKSISQRINSQLANRYNKRSLKVLENEERSYKVTSDVMSSRIQRKLGMYKYSSENTRYELNDKITTKNITIDLKTIIKIFPEEAGKSSVVFSLEYSPVYDTFAQIDLFGKNNAQKYMKEQIALFEKLVAQR